MTLLGPGLRKTPLPKGFSCSGVNCGVRRYRPDLGLVFSETPAVAVGVFTQNTLKAAPVKWGLSLLPSKGVQAVIVNSGQANAATGEQGLADNLEMVNTVAHELDLQVDQVLAASTGVIGQPMEIKKIVDAVPELVGRANNSAEAFATAIMTTDLVPKTVSQIIELDQGTVTLTGICKGSGMIHPNMATMLGFFLSDVQLDTGLAQDFLSSSTEESFNMISVDADPSTNDCAFFLANGASGVSLSSDSDKEKFQAAFRAIGVEMAKSIARDGEGASKLIEVKLTGGPSLVLSRKWARSLVTSPLVKTAIHGGDPNWGRIVAKLGAEGVPEDLLSQLQLKIQGVLIFSNGVEQTEEINAVEKLMKTDEVLIEVNLGSGAEQATAWGCDLSDKYVKINAEYRT